MFDLIEQPVDEPELTQREKAALASIERYKKQQRIEVETYMRMHDPLTVEKTDHPDLLDGIMWADRELSWIRAYGTRCFNHGNAEGMKAIGLLFEKPEGDKS